MKTLTDLGKTELIILFLIAVVVIGGRKVGLFSEKQNKKAAKRVKGKKKSPKKKSSKKISK
jgi:hypothetical protein